MIFRECRKVEIGNDNPISDSKNDSIPRELEDDTEIPGVIPVDDDKIPGVYYHPLMQNKIDQDHAHDRLNGSNLDIAQESKHPQEQPVIKFEPSKQVTEVKENRSQVVGTDIQPQDMLR